MRYCNANIFTPEGYIYGGFRVEEGRFAELLPDAPDGVDLGGAKVLPGLVDIHIHGCAGADFSDGTVSALKTMSTALARSGVTSFAPATMTLPLERIKAAVAAAVRFQKTREPHESRLVGIHLEGPFLSPEKRGAQNLDYLQKPDVSVVETLARAGDGLLRIVDAAPELPGAADFAAQVSRLCTVSAAHTAADYDTAAAYFDAGASHLTHLFNAMPPIHHRRPGVIGAASEREHVTAELICDGIHVHPSAVRMAFRLFPERVCLVSDALRCCSMPEGEYELGGQQVRLSGGAACLPDGTLAGSATDLFRCLRLAIRFGIPEAQAIRAATLRPAQVLGRAGEIGVIQPGARADFLLCDHELNLKQVCLNGQLA